MVNIKEETVQKIVETIGQSGFCIKTGDQAFDFHFTNVFEIETLGEDKKKYNRHHRLQFRRDALAVMKLGKMPFAPEKPIAMAKEWSEARSENKKLREQVEKQSECITQLTDEVEESKSTDTAVLLYQRKYHEERAQKEQIKGQEAEAQSLVLEKDSQLASKNEENAKQEAEISELKKKLAEYESIVKLTRDKDEMI